MFKTIKGKFIFFAISTIILFVGVPYHFFVTQFKNNFDQHAHLLLNSSLDLIELTIDNYMLIEKKDISQFINLLGKSKDIGKIRIIDTAGVIRKSTDFNEIGKPFSNFDTKNTEINLSTLFTREIVLQKEQKMYSAFQPIKNKPECRRCHGNSNILAYLDMDTKLTKAEINFFTGSVHLVFLAFAVLLLLIFIFYYLFNRFVNSPIKKFVLAFNNVGNGNLDTQIKLKQKDEFGIISLQFNKMVDGIKDTNLKLQEAHFNELQYADRFVKLGELAAEMAHQINNPAAIIMTRADYIQHKLAENGLNNELKEDIEVIIKHVNNISNITDSILKYCKKLPREFGQFNLVNVIEESISLLNPIFKERKITVVKKTNTLKSIINGNQVQIEQLMLNLLLNAVDASETFGQITISLDEVDDNKTVLEIADKGCGIEEENLKKIFNPFFTTKSAEKGTGLGLYIVKNICKNHNAEIKCKSRKNEGTVISVTFINS